MAGIGFALRKLIARDDINGVVQAFGYSAFAAAGPWLFTVLCLFGINLVGTSMSSIAEVELFRIIIVYNNCFAILFASPVAVIATRYTSDRIYELRADDIPGVLLVSLGLVYAISLVLAVPLYFFYASLEPEFALLSVINFCLMAGIAVVGVFLTALKDYVTISIVFALGLLTSFVGAWYLAGTFGAYGMLFGFSIGLALIQFIIVTKVFAEYPYHFKFPKGLFGYFPKHWDLAVGIFIYNAAAWVDKWVMWFAPEHRRYDNNLIAYPAYDSSMFLAYLSIIPAVAIFTVILEANFFEKYVVFFRDIMRHCSFMKIKENQKNIVKVLKNNSKDLFILQAGFSILTILISPYIIDFLKLNFSQSGIFRIGVLGALFQVIFLYILIILIYFEIRREVFLLQLLFFGTNLLFSMLSLTLGFNFYGYGYFLSTLISMGAAYLVAVNKLQDLPYLTFITNNTSVRVGGANAVFTNR